MHRLSEASKAKLGVRTHVRLTVHELDRERTNDTSRAPPRSIEASRVVILASAATVRRSPSKPCAISQCSAQRLERLADFDSAAARQRSRGTGGSCIWHGNLDAGRERESTQARREDHAGTYDPRVQAWRWH
jgi:hypothetical protein